MSPLLEQFILESRDFLQGIGENLIALEDRPNDPELIAELFRRVHTLKGNSGLFDVPCMTTVLHAAEDLMDAIRSQQLGFSRSLADALLDAIDLVGVLIDELESDGQLSSRHNGTAQALTSTLRALLNAPLDIDISTAEPNSPATTTTPRTMALPYPPPEAICQQAWQAAQQGSTLFWVIYRPEEDCFFKGEDPFYQARQTPGLLWGCLSKREAWPTQLDAFDCYRCLLDFHMLVAADQLEVDEHFRYVFEQVEVLPIPPLSLIIPQGDANGGPVYGDFVQEALNQLDLGDLAALKASAHTLLELSSPKLWLSSALRWLLLILETSPRHTQVQRRLIESLTQLTPPDFSVITADIQPSSQESDIRALDTEKARIHQEILCAQMRLLELADNPTGLAGCLKSAATTLKACLALAPKEQATLDDALNQSLTQQNAAPLQQWLKPYLVEMPSSLGASPLASPESLTLPSEPEAKSSSSRRPEDSNNHKVLKVDQSKVDRLMNLIGEMVVAKNALPYLASRAEDQYGSRELSREIKAQYAVINRIAEDMQDAIMQVRMMPISFIFQRFPRLVRDISHRLGKTVELQLEGQDTEADKNIVEVLADPLIHLVRNSLDHGLELPEVRRAAGKPPIGHLLIRARQESDRVLIEIIDDGKGIDPAIIKQKAYEKGLLDEAQRERISDQEAINLVFAPGFSTAETISDLSGRGVGMDAVRNAIDKVGGNVMLLSQPGQGTQIRLSLPLSISVTNVMVIETDRQIFGIPMDAVVETVRLPQEAIQTIKQQQATVLRGRIVPLVSLNELLAIPAAPQANDDNELAALVVRVGAEQIALLVDDFCEVVDVILKPLPGELSKLNCYAGTALLGDGSVLMILNPKELL